MKKFLFVFLTIVILLIGGFVFFATQTLNADNFQHQIKQTVQELTGRELTIKGGTQLNWRPMPTITLTDVSLSNIAESEYKNMVQAEKISVEIEWTSIFSSPFKIKNIVMKNPIFVLERNEYNKVNWRFPFLSGQDKLNDTFNTIIANPDAKDTQIESIKIQNGVLHYINEVNNLSLNVENINGQLAVQSLTGPYHFQGDISCLKNNFGLAVQVEEIKNDVPAKFTAKLSEQKSDLLVKLEGTQTPHLSSSIVNIIGDFQLQKPNTFLTLLGLPMMPEAANQPTVGDRKSVV